MPLNFICWYPHSVFQGFGQREHLAENKSKAAKYDMVKSNVMCLSVSLQSERVESLCSCG